MTTTTRRLTASDWQAYFGQLSKGLKLQTVSMFVEGLDLGVQAETEEVTLTGITYDRADDAIEIATDEVRHRIHEPSEVYVQEDDYGALLSLKVTDADGHVHIVQLKSALALPARGESRRSA